MTPAVPSTTPSSPKIARDIGIAIVAGLLLGIGFALLRDNLDDRIRGKDDLEHVVPGTPVLGLIPVIDDWRDRKRPYLVAQTHPKSPPTEAYRGLRTSVQFMSLENPTRVLQITSPSPGDGKTTTSANLAWIMAEAGQRVVLVGCDLRRPRIHEFFGLPNDIGFTSVLLGEAELEDALLRVPNQSHLQVLPTGPVPPNPSELLSSAKTHEVFKNLSARADIVVVDSAPVLPVTDAAVLSTHADAILLVVSAGMDRRRDTVRSVEMLNQINAPIVGTVLNRAPETDSYAYYHYGYGYSERSSAEAKAGREARYADTGVYERQRQTERKHDPGERARRGGGVCRLACHWQTRQARSADNTELADDPESARERNGSQLIGTVRAAGCPLTDIAGNATPTRSVMDRATGCSTAKAHNTRTDAESIGAPITRGGRLFLRWGVAAGVLAILALGALASYSLVRAAQIGARGQDALLSALDEAHAGSGALKLSKGQLASIGYELEVAQSDFSAMQSDLGGGGPLLYLARFVPFAGVQVRGASSLANAGAELSSGTLKLVQTVKGVAFPADSTAQLDEALPDATRLRSVMHAGIQSLAAAVSDVVSLNGKRLVGPLGPARANFAAKLPRVEARAVAAYQGLSALVAFTGGRWLAVLAVSVAEPRRGATHRGLHRHLRGAPGRRGARGARPDQPHRAMVRKPPLRFRPRRAGPHRVPGGEFRAEPGRREREPRLAERRQIGSAPLEGRGRSSRGRSGVVHACFPCRDPGRHRPCAAPLLRHDVDRREPDPGPP